MDLGAYIQIDDFDHILVENNIYVPRLRGLSLMKDEEPYPQDDVDSSAKFIWLWRCRHLNLERYMIQTRDEEGYKEWIDINWRAIHGKKRKKCRFELKKAKRKVENFYKIRNKYCGREDVLRIHARIGGANWYYFGGPELEKQSWFLEKVDNYFDSTYCDIYAKIKGTENEP